LGYVKQEAKGRSGQQAVVDASVFQTNVLWAQLDALYYAYVEPGHIPPRAFRPGGGGSDRLRAFLF
jgi:pyrroloquinoline-quinone synthase